MLVSSSEVKIWHPKQFIKNILSPLLLGVLFFYVNCGFSILNPENINWFFSGDPANHFIGWEHYKNSPWGFPLGVNFNYGGDASTSVVYSDAIPILAIFFKFVVNSKFVTFQYFGFWYLLCSIFQSIASWNLLALKINNYALLCLGTAMLLLSPAFLSMLAINAALSAHFLIIFALYLVLGNKKSYNLIWGILIVISLGVHFYLFSIIFFIFIFNMLDKAKSSSEIYSSIMVLMLMMLVIFFVAWALGYFVSIESTNKGGGFGNIENSFNPITIIYTKEISRIWSALDFKYSPGNGLNYLGMGAIFLFTVAIVNFNKLNLFKSASTAHPFVLISFLFIFIISLSNIVRIGPYEIYVFYPDFLIKALNNIRATRRLFWPIHYSLIFITIFSITQLYKVKTAFFILLFAFTLQCFDMSQRVMQYRDSLNSYINPAFHALKSSIWLEYPRYYNNLMKFPMELEPNPQYMFEVFSQYAATNHMVTNAIYPARPNVLMYEKINTDFSKMIASGRYDKNSLYIVDDDLIIPILLTLNPSLDQFSKIDNFNVLAPGWNGCKECPKITANTQINMPIPPKVSIGEDILFSKNKIGGANLIGVGLSQYTGTGWSYPEEWGVWADGRSAKALFPYPIESRPKSLTLKMKAFVGEGHPSQKFKVFINGKFKEEIILSSPELHKIKISLDSVLIDQYCLIEFKFMNPVSPKMLKMGDDSRNLSIGLISASFD